MLTIETKELEIDKELLKKVNMICKFANVKPTITNGSIKNIKGTNIAYVKPHILNINNTNYLLFNECDYIFVNDYKEKINFKELLNIFMIKYMVYLAIKMINIKKWPITYL